MYDSHLVAIIWHGASRPGIRNLDHYRLKTAIYPRLFGHDRRVSNLPTVNRARVVMAESWAIHYGIRYVAHVPIGTPFAPPLVNPAFVISLAVVSAEHAQNTNGPPVDDGA